MKNILCILSTLGACFTTTVALCLELATEECVYEHIFVNKSYNKHLRPVNNGTAPVIVEIELVVLSLQDITEIDEVMTTQAFLRTRWYDKRLQWDLEKFGNINEIVVPADIVWRPDIILSNSASQFYEKTYREDFRVAIHHSGRVLWSFGGTITTACDMVLDKYPFDTQTCTIEIESWLYEKKAVDLMFYQGGGFDLNLLGRNVLWYLTGNKTESILKYKQSYRALIFTMEWTRKPLYYYINILLPAVMLMAVTLGVYWLPEDSGEKISLAITLLLAFSVFQIVIMSSTPVNSDAVPELTQFVVGTISLTTLALLTSMLIAYIGGRSAEKPPKWLRYICHDVLARIMFMDRPDGNELEKTEQINKNYFTDLSHEDMVKYSMHFTSLKKYNNFQNFQYNFLNHDNDQDRYYSVPQSSKDVKKILFLFKKMIKKEEEKALSERFVDEWKRLARIIDRTMFWVTVLLLGVATMYIFLKNK